MPVRNHQQSLFPAINNDVVIFQGISYTRKQIIDGVNFILNRLIEELPSSVEPYKTALKTLQTLLIVFSKREKDLLKTITKEALHQLVNVIREYNLNRSYTIEQIRINNDWANLLHYFIEFEILNKENQYIKK